MSFTRANQVIKMFSDISQWRTGLDGIEGTFIQFTTTMNFGSNRQAAILTDEGLTLINPTTGVVLSNMSGHIVDIVHCSHA